MFKAVRQITYVTKILNQKCKIDILLFYISICDFRYLWTAATILGTMGPCLPDRIVRYIKFVVSKDKGTGRIADHQSKLLNCICGCPVSFSILENSIMLSWCARSFPEIKFRLLQSLVSLQNHSRYTIFVQQCLKRCLNAANWELCNASNTTIAIAFIHISYLYEHRWSKFPTDLLHCVVAYGIVVWVLKLIIDKQWRDSHYQQMHCSL